MTKDEALRMALEYLEESNSYLGSLDYSEPIAAIKEALAQPEREWVGPVAWRTFDGEGGYDYRSFEDNENHKEDYIKRNGDKYKDWVEPLYTTPQQRTWVGLTDEDEIDWDGVDAMSFARAIEAKLK